MGRPPLAVGTFGKIDFLVLGTKRVRARASFRDFDGRRRLVTRYGETRAHAERRLREALRDRSGPADDESTADRRVSSMAAAWLTEVDESDLAPNTRRLYHFAVDAYVVPGMGELRLREVTVPAVDRLLTAVRRNHGPGAAKSARSALSGILGLAVRHGALHSNPVREVPGRRAHRRPTVGPRALTVEESRQLRKRLAADREAARLDLPDLVDFMLGTGVRIGEACGLRWSAVDLGAAVARIEATTVRVRGRGLMIQDFPKTTAGRRTIALPGWVIDLLGCRRQQQLVTPGDAVVFPSPGGRLRDPHNTSRDLRTVLDRADFAWVTSHVFRKTVATRLDEAGLSARQIADHLGHTRPSLTQDVYMGRGLASPEAAAALDKSR